MPGSAIEGVRLDHVAHAVPRWQDVWERYATELGAEWSSGGPGPGFAPGQVRFGNDARLEILMPNDPHLNDFLQRFLQSNGPGPHHLTFKVPNLTDAIDHCRAVGFEPIGINRTDPEWMEAFLHPKVASGVVVQLAEAPNAWSSPPPDDYPTARRQRRDGSGPVPPAALRRVVHAVADPERAADLFVGLLGADVAGTGEQPDHRWMDLDWGGPLSLRLVAPRGEQPVDTVAGVAPRSQRSDPPPRVRRGGARCRGRHDPRFARHPGTRLRPTRPAVLDHRAGGQPGAAADAGGALTALPALARVRPGAHQSRTPR